MQLIIKMHQFYLMKKKIWKKLIEKKRIKICFLYYLILKYKLGILIEIVKLMIFKPELVNVLKNIYIYSKRLRGKKNDFLEK